MQKATILLVKKSASRAVDQARIDGSRRSHSDSIEELDNNGNKIVETPVENVAADGGDDIVPRKRRREEEMGSPDLAL